MKYFLLLLLIIFGEIANAQMFWVTNNTNSGAGSLRQAIIDVNNSNFSNPGIYFLLPGGATTISIFSPLPIVTVPFLYIADINNDGAKITVNGNNLPGPIFYSTGINGVNNGNYITGINFSPTSYYVTNTNDYGLGSLRLAQSYCEQTTSIDYIYFNIPGTPPHAITLNTNLPTFYQSVRIDGTSQASNGYTGNMPKIEVQRRLQIGGANSEIYGLTFKNGAYLYLDAQNINYNANNCVIGQPNGSNVFLSPMGIMLQQCKNTLIQNNYIGMDVNSNFTTSMSNHGINAWKTFNTVISNNTIGNFIDGIHLDYDTNTVIKGNRIGTDVSGSSKIPNQKGISASSISLKIGGSLVSDRNIISGNTNNGISIYGTKAQIKGNYLGSDNSGTNLLENGSDAIFVGGVDSLILGGNYLNEGNLIVSTTSNGIHAIRISFSQKVHICGNKIGVAKDGITQLGGSKIGSNSIYIETQSNVEVGKLATNFGNVFSNYNAGVLVNYYGSASAFNSNVLIRGNSFFNNNSGIINTIIPRPVITSITSNTIQGVAVPLATIDLYYHNGTGAFQGRTFIATVIANSSGRWSYTGLLINHCTITATATISSNTSDFSQEFWFGNVGPDLSVCQNSPSVQLQATSGISYNWSPSTGLDNSNVANPIFTTDLTQTYTVSVTNSLGCIGRDTLTVNVIQSPIDVASSVTNNTCSGSNDGQIVLTPTNSNDNYTYLWNTGESGSSILNLIGNTSYSVTVSAAGVCSKTLDFFIGSPSPVIINSNVVNDFCNGAQGGAIQLNSISGGTLPYYFLWSSGAQTQNISNLMAGAYSLKISDANLCSQLFNFSISEPEAIQISSTANNVTCNGYADGFINVNTTGGVSPYAYLWSTGQSTANISNIISGDYSVEVTDANNCKQTAAFLITEPTAFIVGLDLPQNLKQICEGDASDLVLLEGGTPLGGEYSGTYVNSNMFTPYFVNVYPITYTYTYQTCTQTAIADIEVIVCNATGNQVKINEVDFDIVPNPSQNFISIMCGNSFPVTCDIYNSIGQLVKQIILNNQEEQISVENLSNGIYFLKATTTMAKHEKTLIIKH